MTQPTHLASFSSFDLLDAFAESGCPICRLGLRSVDRFLDAMNYDSVNDPAFREQLNGARGFCNMHAYQWLENAFVLGTAEIYRDIISRIAEDLRGLHQHAPGMAERLSSLLGSPAEGSRPGPASAATASCPACAHLAETEAVLTRTLVQELGDAEFRERYEQSSGLCRPHLGPALDAAPSAAVFDTLRDAAVRQEETLVRQMDEIIRKHDYRYRDEVAGEERGAAHRAVAHAIGARNALPIQLIDQ